MIAPIAPTVMIPTSRPYSIRSCPESSRTNRVRTAVMHLPPRASSPTTPRLALLGVLLMGNRSATTVSGASYQTSGAARAAPFVRLLGKLPVQVVEVGCDLGADRDDRPDRAYRDDSNEQTVFNQVLPRIITH